LTFFQLLSHISVVFQAEVVMVYRCLLHAGFSLVFEILLF